MNRMDECEGFVRCPHEVAVHSDGWAAKAAASLVHNGFCVLRSPDAGGLVGSGKGYESHAPSRAVAAGSITALHCTLNADCSRALLFFWLHKNEASGL